MKDSLSDNTVSHNQRGERAHRKLTIIDHVHWFTSNELMTDEQWLMLVIDEVCESNSNNAALNGIDYVFINSQISNEATKK